MTRGRAARSWISWSIPFEERGRVGDLLRRHEVADVHGRVDPQWGERLAGRQPSSLVVDDWAHPPAEIRRILEAAGFTVEGPLTGNLGTRFVIEPGGFETDIWLPPDTEVHRGEMARRQMLEWHGRPVPVMGSEDFVLRKVVTFRLRRKTTDLDDAYQVLMVARDTIDRSRLVQWASFYRVEKLMEELIEVAREDRAALAGKRGPEV